MALVKEFKRHETTIIGNLAHDKNQLIRTKAPEIPTFASWHDVGFTVLCWVLGLLPFVPIPYDSLSAPYLTRQLIRKRNYEAA